MQAAINLDTMVLDGHTRLAVLDMDTTAKRTPSIMNLLTSDISDIMTLGCE